MSMLGQLGLTYEDKFDKTLPDKPAAENVTLYKLIARQLHDDGYIELANTVSLATSIPLDDELELHQLSKTLKAYEKLQNKGDDMDLVDEKNETSQLPSYSSRRGGGGGGVAGGSQPFANYETKFITTHKDECRCAVFSRDGTLAATGSADSSIKLLDVSKMHYHEQAKQSGEDYQTLKPVIRTFYDHVAAVNDLDFHPTASLLASCSQDCSIKFFDHEKLLVKRSYKHVVETAAIRTLHFHPSGDYILSGGEQPYIRLYNVNTFQAYISPDVHKQHTKAINQVRYARDGSSYVSCSKDGTIKLWDGVGNTCINTIRAAHGGEEVSSVEFTKDKKYLLSGGKDSTARLWELSTGREILSFGGCFQRDFRLQTCFSPDENYCLSADERTHAIVAWDRHTGEQVREFTGHNKVVKFIAVSPSEQAFVSCSTDHRARFWAADQL